MEKKPLLTRLFPRLSSKHSSGQYIGPDRRKVPSMKLLFFIVNWHDAHVIIDVFNKEKVWFYFGYKGRGMANSEVLDILGIGTGDKAVICCLEPDEFVQVLFKEIRKKLRFNSPSTGIAFTIPLSAINDPILLIFQQSMQQNGKSALEQKPSALGQFLSANKGENMADKISHDLIIAIVNHGYSDELVNTAREAGASGGTIVNARGQAHEGAVKFFGISVQDEREMIMILSSREKKISIMQAISEAHGLNSNAQGIVFSLPVEEVMGLSFE